MPNFIEIGEAVNPRKGISISMDLNEEVKKNGLINHNENQFAMWHVWPQTKKSELDIQKQ